MRLKKKSSRSKNIKLINIYVCSSFYKTLCNIILLTLDATLNVIKVKEICMLKKKTKEENKRLLVIQFFVIQLLLLSVALHLQHQIQEKQSKSSLLNLTLIASPLWLSGWTEFLLWIMFLCFIFFVVGLFMYVYNHRI